MRHCRIHGGGSCNNKGHRGQGQNSRVSAQMGMFQYLYGIMLSEMILRHADNLSRTLQHKSLSAEEGQQVAQVTVDTITSLPNDDAFDLISKKVSRESQIFECQ